MVIRTSIPAGSYINIEKGEVLTVVVCNGKISATQSATVTQSATQSATQSTTETQAWSDTQTEWSDTQPVITDTEPVVTEQPQTDEGFYNYW